MIYWGDSSLWTIEKAYLNGSGREILIRRAKYGYFYALALCDGNLYIVDPTLRYGYCTFKLVVVILIVGTCSSHIA